MYRTWDQRVSDPVTIAFAPPMERTASGGGTSDSATVRAARCSLPKRDRGPFPTVPRGRKESGRSGLTRTWGKPWDPRPRACGGVGHRYSDAPGMVDALGGRRGVASATVGTGGEGGIRTLGRGFSPLRRFSKPLLSTTQPPLRVVSSTIPDPETIGYAIRLVREEVFMYIS